MGFLDRIRAASGQTPATDLGSRNYRTRAGAAGAYMGAGLPERTARRREVQGLYDRNLQDPTKAAGRFNEYIATAARGISDPAMRDFNQELSDVGAQTAARFGGNASSEEMRNVYNTSDLFSRNLTEAIARLAPQGAGLGLQYLGELGGAASAAATEEDRLGQMILEGISTQHNVRKRGGGLGRALGTIAGGVGGYFLGGPAGAAAGARIGGGG